MISSYIRLLVFQVAVLSASGLSAQNGDLKIEMTVTPTLSPCMEAVRLDFRIENAGSSTFTPVELNFGLPQGMTFIAGTQQGVSLGAGSELTAPVFALPVVAPFGVVAFSFDIRTACNLTTASRPIRVVLKYNGVEYPRNIDNLNLRIPALSMIGMSQLTYTGVPGEAFTRSIRFRVANIGDIYNLYILSNHTANGVTFVSSNIPTTEATLPDGRVARLIDRAYFNTFGNGDGAFNIADSTLVYEETVRIEQCNGGAGLISVAYGCDGNICDNSTISEPTNVIVNRETTQLSWSIANNVLPGFCSPGSFTVTLTNTGAFMARDLILEPGLVSLLGSPNTAGRSTCILFTGFSVNGTALIHNLAGYSGYGLDFAQLQVDPDGAGGLTDANGDGYYNDLPPGASVTLVIQVELAQGCLGGNSFLGFRFGMTTYFNDGCSASSDIRIHQNSNAFNIQLSLPEVSDNLRVEYADGDEVNVLFLFRRENSSAGANTLLSACTGGETVYRIVVPHILDFPANFGVRVNGIQTPYDRLGDTVVVRVPGYTAQIGLNLVVACNVTVGNSEYCPVSGALPSVHRFEYRGDYYCDFTNCPQSYRLYSGNSSPFVVDCDEPPATTASGVRTSGFTARRLTLGWTDSSLSEQVSPNNPDIRPDRAYRYDLVKFTITGKAMGAGIFDTSYFDLIHYSGRSQPRFYALADTLSFYDSETSEWLSCPMVLSDSTANAGGIYSYYYSMAPLFQPGGCLAGRHLTGGDSLKLEVIARVDGYVPRELDIINLLGAGINYVVSQDTFRCGRHGAAFSTADPGYVFETALRHSRLSCDTLTMVFNLAQGTDEANPTDLFPNEFRPYVVFDSIRAVIPASLNYVPNSTSVIYQYFNETTGAVRLDTVTVQNPVASSQGGETILRFNNNMNYPNVDVLRRRVKNELSFQVVPNCIAGPKYVQSTVFANTYRYAKESGFSRSVVHTTSRSSSFLPPVRVMNVVTPEYTGSSDTARWQVEICVRPLSNDTEIVPNNWLSIDTEGLNIRPLQARDLATSQQVFNFVPIDSSGLYWAKIDTLIGGRCHLLELTALIGNCDTVAMNLNLGYSCSGYPLHPDSAYQQCNNARISDFLYIVPRPARLDIGTVIEPNGPTQLCRPIQYEFTIINGEIGGANNVEVLLYANSGVGIVPGSCELRLGNGPYIPIPDPEPDTTDGTLQRWLLSEYPGSPIFNKELAGFTAAPDNILHLRFQMETDCSYRPESTIRYAVQWQNRCSDALNSSSIFFGQPLSLVGAPTEKNTYALAIEQPTATNACVAALPVHITLTNQGGTSSGLTFAEEQIKIILPAGATYQPGSYVAVENMPSGIEPGVILEGTTVALLLPMLPGVAVGGALSFQIELSIDAAMMANCGLYPLIVETRQVAVVPCVTADMGVCDLSFLSSRSGAALEITKNIAAFSGANIQAAVYTTTTERWLGQAVVRNQGALPLGGLTQVRLYLDLDGNGLFDPGIDSLIYTQSIAAEGLLPTESIDWDFDFLMAGVHTCHGVHLVLERGVNCLCADASIYLPPPGLHNAGPNHRLCRDENATLGHLPMTGYAYQWSPAEYLSDATLASPAFLNDNLATATGQAIFAYALETIRQGGCTSTDTLLVEVRDLRVQLTALTDYNGYEVSCAGHTDGQIGATTSFGYAPLAYNWSTGHPTVGTLEDLGAGSYTLTVTDAEGCTSMTTQVLQEPLPLVVDLNAADYNGYNTRCHLSTDGQITAVSQGGVGGYVYSWLHSGQADSLLTGLTAGTYLLLVTDRNGCEHTDSITLISPPPLVAVDTLLTQPLCYGGANGSVALTFAGGVPPYIYDGAMITGATLLDTSLGAGAYNYVLNDQNNCPYTGTFSLEEQVSTFDLTMQPVRCHGESNGSIAAVALMGFPPYQWAWSDGQAQALAVNLPAGSYELSITDGNGCPYLLVAEVTEPPLLGASVSGADALCHGSADGTLRIVVAGGVPDYAIQVNGMAAVAEVSGLAAGQYALLVVDDNGCVWDSIAFIGQPLPLTLSVDTLVDATCHGYSDGRIAVSAQGGTPPYQYQWGHGAAGAALSGLPAAWYSLLIADAHNCLLADSIAVAQPILPQPVFVLTEPNCFGYRDGRVSIQGRGLESYIFGLDSLRLQEAPTFEELPAGNYTLFLRNADGCAYTFPFVLPSPPERFIEVFRDQTIRLGDSAEIEVRSLFPLMDIDWSGGDSIRCPDCPSTYVRPIYTQDYVVQVISDKGCFNEGQVRIVVDRRDLIYAPNAFSPNDDGVNDQFTLFGGSAAVRIESLQIFDRWGNQLFRAEGIPLNDLSSGWDGTFRGRPMNAGVYVFQARVRLVDGSVEERKGEVNLVR